MITKTIETERRFIQKINLDIENQVYKITKNKISNVLKLKEPLRIYLINVK